MGNSKSDMVSPESNNEIKPNSEKQSEMTSSHESYDEEINPDFDFPKVTYYTLLRFYYKTKKSRQVY